MKTNLPTKYYHHPESECIWKIENCTDEKHSEQFDDDGCVNELSYDQYKYWYATYTQGVNNGNKT